MPLQKTLPSRILIVRLSALGDVIQTLPVLSALRNSFPNATIGWLVESDAEPLLRENPMIDYLHVSHRKKWLRSLKNPFQWRQTCQEIIAFWREIHQVHYQVGLDLQGLIKSSLSLFFTGIQHRLGYASAREMAALFYTKTIAISSQAYFDPSVPMTDHALALAKALGCTGHSIHYPLSPVTPDEASQAQELLAVFSNTHPIIALAPATQWDSKHWLQDYWMLLIQDILRKTDFNLILVGGKTDRQLIETILSTIPAEQQQNRVLNLAGKTPLKVLQALLEKVDALIGLDSAPLHLAGAVGKAKLIGLYGPTGYRRTPPPNAQNAALLTTEGELSCQPCHQKRCPLGTMECMHRLTPEQVFQELITLVSNAPVTKRC